MVKAVDPRVQYMFVPIGNKTNALCEGVLRGSEMRWRIRDTSTENVLQI